MTSARLRVRAVVAVPALLAGLRRPTPTASATPPNVVVVVTDDMRASDWQALPQTRELFGNGGTEFPNFFLTTPTCAPSRASILTGRYAHNHGVETNEDGGAATGGLTAFRRRGLADDTIAFALQRAGYRTAAFGKFINGYNPEDPPIAGWDRWAVSGENSYTRYRLNVDGEVRRNPGYLTDVLRDEALRFLAETPAETPVFLYFAPRAPHGPSTPAKRHRDAFRGAEVEHDASFAEEDAAGKPAFVQEQKRLGAKAERRLDKEERDRLASLLAVDEAIVAIWDALAAKGRLDNTYLFVFSDNGYLLGQHGLVGKGTAYDGSARVPMLAYGPGFDRARDDRIVANIDVAPTIAHVAGIDFPADGQSLLDPAAREAILIERFQDSDKPPYRALRTERLLYVEWGTGERELYDYRKDPLETANLLAEGGDGKKPRLIAKLSKQLAALARCEGETCRTASAGG